MGYLEMMRCENPNCRRVNPPGGHKWRTGQFFCFACYHYAKNHTGEYRPKMEVDRANVIRQIRNQPKICVTCGRRAKEGERHWYFCFEKRGYHCRQCYRAQKRGITRKPIRHTKKGQLQQLQHQAETKKYDPSAFAPCDNVQCLKILPKKDLYTAENSLSLCPECYFFLGEFKRLRTSREIQVHKEQLANTDVPSSELGPCNNEDPLFKKCASGVCDGHPDDLAWCDELSCWLCPSCLEYWQRHDAMPPYIVLQKLGQNQQQLAEKNTASWLASHHEFEKSALDDDGLLRLDVLLEQDPVLHETTPQKLFEFVWHICHATGLGGSFVKAVPVLEDFLTALYRLSQRQSLVVNILTCAVAAYLCNFYASAGELQLSRRWKESVWVLHRDKVCGVILDNQLSASFELSTVLALAGMVLCLVRPAGEVTMSWDYVASLFKHAASLAGTAVLRHPLDIQFFEAVSDWFWDLVTFAHQKVPFYYRSLKDLTLKSVEASIAKMPCTQPKRCKRIAIRSYPEQFTDVLSDLMGFFSKLETRDGESLDAVNVWSIAAKPELRGLSEDFAKQSLENYPELVSAKDDAYSMCLVLVFRYLLQEDSDSAFVVAELEAIRDVCEETDVSSQAVFELCYICSYVLDDKDLRSYFEDRMNPQRLDVLNKQLAHEKPAYFST